MFRYYVNNRTRNAEAGGSALGNNKGGGVTLSLSLSLSGTDQNATNPEHFLSGFFCKRHLQQDNVDETIFQRGSLLSVYKFQNNSDPHIYSVISVFSYFRGRYVNFLHLIIQSHALVTRGVRGHHSCSKH